MPKEKVYRYVQRGGNRGGQDLFKWEDLKVMRYQDREQYMGFSTKIGFLDKGGKWRKKDWYAQKKGDGGEDHMAEIKRIQAEDEKRMRIAMGLEEKVEDVQSKLNNQELQEINIKIKTFDNNERTAYCQDNEDEQQNKELRGLGFDRKKQDDKDVLIGINKLEGEGLTKNDLKKLQDPNFVPEQDKKTQKRAPSADKKIKKDKKSKKAKKDKKEKKGKRKHKKRLRSESSSSSD